MTEENENLNQTQQANLYDQQKLAEQVSKIEENVVKNPLLDAIKLPGQKFRLPSKGRLYDDGVLSSDVIDGEVEVRPMSAIDDITLKTPDLLFDGSAILKVIRNCVPQVKQPEKLLSRDVDHILACLRKVSYGDALEVSWLCKNASKLEEKHNTELEEGEEPLKIKHRKYTVNLSNIINNKTIELEDEMLDLYKLILSNGQVVTFKPFTFMESVNYSTASFEMETGQFEDISEEEYAKKVMEISILPTIHDVNGVESREFVKEWLYSLPRTLFDEIKKHYEKVPNFGSDFAYEVKCQDCGEVEEITSSINPVGFFMQP